MERAKQKVPPGGGSESNHETTEAFCGRAANTLIPDGVSSKVGRNKERSDADPAKANASYRDASRSGETRGLRQIVSPRGQRPVRTRSETRGLRQIV
ncbi:hypothetical protein K227x_11180 [Rubripirellula lacrimiformis]|uniref:Uncharacterized protein n=1 Tax=Rubripirellula lacrimiformis TaxID=1930273 RepID=A0A517N6J8_9BACT|nr:hypothetical protein K227x_11180 [Rubripirellula lacrimiformis]